MPECDNVSMKKSKAAGVIVPTALVAGAWVACPESHREALAVIHEHIPEPEPEQEPFQLYRTAGVVSSTSAGFAFEGLYRLDLKAHRRMMRHVIALGVTPSITEWCVQRPHGGCASE